MTSDAEVAYLLAVRVREAENYLIALEEYETRSWQDLYLSYKSGELSLPQTLVLVHPRYYQEREIACGYSIRGDSLFPQSTNRYDLRCDAEQVWGLPCQLRRYESLQVDHF